MWFDPSDIFLDLFIIEPRHDDLADILIVLDLPQPIGFEKLVYCLSPVQITGTWVVVVGLVYAVETVEFVEG
jgi:hypothetical protein